MKMKYYDEDEMGKVIITRFVKTQNALWNQFCFDDCEDVK